MDRLRSLFTNRWARYALTASLLLLLVLKIEPGRILSAMRSADPEYLLLALALTVPFVYLKVLRWHLMLREGSINATFGAAAVSLLGGMGLALITPARLGELVRVVYLRDRQKWKIGGLVMIDKGFDVLVLVCLSVGGAWALLGSSFGLIFSLAAVLGLLIVYNPRRLHGALDRLPARLPLRSRLQQVWDSLDSLGPLSTSLFILLTVAAFAIVLLQFGIILLSWRSWSAQVVLFTFPLVILTNVLPITIGGLGIREGAAALLLAHYGVSAADAALSAFLMFAINTGLPGLVGALFLPQVRGNVVPHPAQSLDPP